MKTFLIALIGAGAVLAQTKSDPTKAAPKAAAPAPKAVADLLNPSSLKAKAPDVFRAKLTTTRGDIIVEVTRAWAPLGADRFYNLVRAGFFTNATFFRVVPNFVVQFGISPRPDVARVWENARIVDDPVRHSNKRGTITFATAGANTRTTQLFINYSDNVPLDSMGFAAFGEVVQGMDTVVDKIYSGYGQRPDQGRLQAEGKAYTDREFPMLDKILSAAIVPLPTAPPADGKAADTKAGDTKK
jgi:peptidyl-prolyl cis-trans isomerase A (cyclophilin A)